MIVVGSGALIAAGINIHRGHNDVDLLATMDEFNSFLSKKKDRVVLAKPTKFGYALFISGHKPVEIEIAEKNKSSALLYQWASDQSFVKSGVRYASPCIVHAMKLTHRYLRDSPHFLKTMHDIHLLRSRGAWPYNVPENWFKQRELETYDYDHPNLKQEKRKFFKDDFYVYDHDTIHQAVKVGADPAYTYFKEPGAEVYCSKDRFDALPRQTRLNAVIEESYVLALERHQIPNKFVPNRRDSFNIALRKVCTSITSGWFREFAWENYDAASFLYNDDYVDKFHAALANGTIKEFAR